MSSEGDIRAGRISSVRVQKNDPTRVSIFVNDEFSFGLDAAIASEHGLRKDVAVAPDQILTALRADAAHRAFKVALHMLSYRTRTVQEIRRGLSRKGFEQEAIDSALERLIDRKYLDDRSLATSYAAARAGMRGEGHHRIRLRLLRRGVAREIVDDVIADLQPEVDWLEVAREQASMRWKRLGTSQDLRRRQKKLFDFLVRKGFDFDVARQVTAEFEDHSGD